MSILAMGNMRLQKKKKNYNPHLIQLLGGSIFKKEIANPIQWLAAQAGQALPHSKQGPGHAQACRPKPDVTQAMPRMGLGHSVKAAPTYLPAQSECEPNALL